MPDIDILNPHSSLCTPYEQYQEYLGYGEQVGSFFAADADADAQHDASGAGSSEEPAPRRLSLSTSWMMRDARAPLMWDA